MFKVIVAGSRDFNDYDLLSTKLIHFLSRYKPEDIEIVSGGARGADSLGERFADEKGCNKEVFPANWNRQPDGSYDKSAGFKRNWEMAKYADACVVFMHKDGTDGSQHMIDLAEREGIRLKVVRYGGEQ